MDAEEGLGDTLISKNRLEALVDGVFAFAMTLLVVGLGIPSIPKAEAATELPVYISSMFPQFLSFLIAFFILASLWIVHHEHFHFIRSVNKIVLWLNILILIFVVLVPFSTNLSGAYPHVPIAPLIFHANMLILSSLFLVHWQYIIRRPALLTGPIHPDRILDAVMDRVPIILAALVGMALVISSEPFSSMYTYLIFPLLMRVVMWYVHSRRAHTRA
ncbi:TMEM175 family protein [Methanoregula sp.]|uniref:TMEM175 family protein n=1 Tax=Methanoregula sp. TaxID=2052170 RepID=UPI002C75D388|nr:TMEM175 family protein [Methanoregula sp.]HVP96431.1 TMEM175 family protein [Methanoregula sp.]